MNDPKVEKQPPVPPFVQFCVSAVPQVFDNSMSYYETVCALWKYLNDTVNVINNNAMVTEDFIAKVNELHAYVENYFANLDVQEEINNKLDQMAEDGTLQEIITSYIQANVAWTFDTVADMKLAENLIAGSYAQTLGFHTINDGGGAIYKISDSGTADEMSVIAVGSLYANLESGDTVKVEQLGAYGDETHDDSASIQKAFDSEKIVEFAPKTYLCFNLTCNYPTRKLVINGNGATLKRPQLNVAPYNKTVSQMKWIKTIVANTSIEIHDLNFDNNCFTMWSKADGYAQEQSASIQFNNDTTKFRVVMDNCSCKNSAGDGIMIVNNAVADITNYVSTECFRGGITIVGNSDVNIDNWSSNAITLPDGIDIEIDSATVTTTPPHININNVTIDYDVDLSIKNNGSLTVNNLVMREFDYDAYQGFLANNMGGTMLFTNCLLRRGNVNTNQSNYFDANNAVCTFSNCTIIGTSNSNCVLFRYAQGALTNYSGYKLIIDNCVLDAYKIIACSAVNGDVYINNCKVKCYIFNSGVSPVAFLPYRAYFTGNDIEMLGDESVNGIQFAANQYSPNGQSYFTFLGNSVHGNQNAKMYIASYPIIYFDSTPLESCYITNVSAGGTPKYYGLNRLIVVPSADVLTFKGFVAGEDIAIAKDTGKRYRYTSGTTWTEIV